MLKAGALALALLAVISIVVLLSSRPASAETQPKADYRFQGTLKSTVDGAPDLANIGPGTNTFTTDTVDGQSTKVLSFPQGNGVKLSDTSGVIPNGSPYTIVALFKFDSVSGYRRIIDFKNGISDTGLYVLDGKLEFYDGTLHPPAGTGAPFLNNTYVQVVLTRDANGTVAGYVDGIPQFSFSDTSGNAVIDDANNTLRFFRDNESGGVTTEHSSGSVARIRLYNSALSATAVGKLDRLEPTNFVVNSIADDPDSESRDGRCDAYATITGDQCTLRAAISQADWTMGNDTINFSSGLNFSSPRTIALGRLITIEDANGDSLTINGPGANKLAVSGNNASTVFDIPLASVTINGLTIKNGESGGANGGGIYNASGSLLTLNNSTVSSNISSVSGSGGGIYNRGTLTLNNSTVSGNTAGTAGGGIFNSSNSGLTVTNSTFSGNKAPNGSGGGILADDPSTQTLTNSTLSGNSAGVSGGGIHNDSSSASGRTLRNTIVAGNTAPGGPDAYGNFQSQGNNLIGNISD
ncbi:MAG: LamG domain-containing protein, partial [Actinomycetota bacterium]|nr:LamG domain-containing protein [Actinomycetota bacterium]